MNATEPNYPPDVFISYSDADGDWVRNWLIPHLKAANLQVYTPDDFTIGAARLLNLEQAVEQSRKTLLVLTPSWLTNEQSKFANMLVQTDDPVGQHPRMLPLMLEKCELPSRLSLLECVDFTDQNRWETQLARLIEAISGIPDSRQTSPLPTPGTSFSRPFRLPQVDITNFTGRGNELAQLEELLLKRDGPKVCSIVGLSGVGGIGKSALACHFAEQHREDFPDGIIGLRVDGKDVDAIAREFARHCGEKFEPDDERDATTIMHEVFRHRRALLIFDNADTANIRLLHPGGAGCAVIVTARDKGLPISLDIPVKGQIDLPPLPDPDSLDLLKRLVGEARVAAEEDAAYEIISLVGNLPLALRIVGGILQIHSQRSLARYANSLREERGRLERLKIRGGSKDLDLRAVFSLSLESLESSEIDFFACLSVCAESGFSVQTAIAVGNCDDYITEKRLDYLYQLSLLSLSQSGEERYVFHSLIRLFAQELAIERSSQEEAEERHAHFFIELVKSSDVRDHEVASVIIEELDNIILAAKWLQRQQRIDLEFILRFEPFLELYGRWQEALDLMSRFLSLAERLEQWDAIVQFRVQHARYLILYNKLSEAQEALRPVEDILDRIESSVSLQHCEVMWLSTLGSIQQKQAQLDEAIDAFQRCCVIYEQLDDQLGVAKVLNKLGGVLRQQGRFDEAIESMESSYAIYEELSDQHGIAKVLNSLGGVLRNQGHFEDAVNVFQRSAAVEEQLGNQRGQAMVLTSLGGVLRDQGHFNEAVETFERSQAISEQLGDQRSLGMVLNSLGGVFQRQGHFNEAVETFERSRAISEQLGDQRGLGMVLNSLGGVFQRQGHFNEAVETFERSRAISEQSGDQRSLAMVLTSLGGVLHRQRRFDEAVETFERSRTISEQSDDQRSLAMVLNSLGGVLRDQGHFDEAVDTFQRSAEIGEKLDDRRHLAMVLTSLGGVLHRQGRFDEAVETFERSRAILEQLSDQRGLAMMHFMMGKALLSYGDTEKAIVNLSRSFEINEKLENRQGLGIVTPALVQALLKLGKHDEAQSYCQRALVIAPKNKRLLELRERLSSPRRDTGMPVHKQGFVKCIIQHAQGYRYGFIVPDDGGPDIYFGEGYIEPDCLSKLAAEVRVEVEVEHGQRGPHAKNIKIIESDTPKNREKSISENVTQT